MYGAMKSIDSMGTSHESSRHRSRIVRRAHARCGGDNMNSFEPAHSPFGGSVATRVLRCPASVSLVEKVPAHLRKVSAYAQRGTAIHIAMAQLIENASSFDDIVG